MSCVFLPPDLFAESVYIFVQRFRLGISSKDVATLNGLVVSVADCFFVLSLTFL